MVTKKSDKETTGDEKSKSSVFGLVKSMADKLNPDLGMVEETNSKNNDSGKDTDETASKKESKVEKKVGTKSYNSEIKAESKTTRSTTHDKVDSKNSNENDTDSSSKTKLKAQFHKLSSFIQEDRDRIIKIAGVVIGVIFILWGIYLIFGSSEKVVDNVAFGERSVASSFLVIVGILVIAGVFAQDIMKRTSFNNLFDEVQDVEKDSSSKSEKQTPAKKENEEKVNVQNSDSSKNRKE